MIDAYASLAHYADHLAPVWEAIDADGRGTFWGEARVLPRLRALSIAARGGRPGRGRRIVMVAGAHDVWRVRGHVPVLIEHGAGQAYDCDDPGWSGGIRRDEVALFLCPNEVSAGRNRAAYPSTPSVVVGSPHVEALRRIRGENGADTIGAKVTPTAALSFHHPGVGKAPEAGWALPHYEAALPTVVAQLRAAGLEVLGHGHPRARRHFARLWRSLGVEYVECFDDVVRRASVYVVDNSSTMFEAAACGIPVVVLNAPWYRRDVDLWPRFWQVIPGNMVDDAVELAQAVLTALDDPPYLRDQRRWAVREVYGDLDGQSAARSAGAIRSLAQALT